MIGSRLKLAIGGGLFLLGTGLLMAASSPTGYAIPTPKPTTSCEDVLRHRPNTDTTWTEDAGGGDFVQHTVVSLKLFADPPDVDKGKWIGIVIRNSPVGVSSPLFPSLTPYVPACIFFQYDKGAGVSYAWLQEITDSVNATMTPLAHAAFCENDTLPGYPKHPAKMKPQIKRYPFKCDTLRVTFATARGPLPVLVPNYRSGGTEIQLRRAIALAIKARDSAWVSTKSVISQTESLLAVYKGETGPWFPCTQTDCCRVFSDAEQ